jgi:hypothetical protein
VTQPDSKRIAARYLAQKQGQVKTAGEVVFKKDRSGDAQSWAYHDVAPSERQIGDDFNYSPKNLKPLAKVMRSSLAALGHTLSAYNTFAKIKSARVSPDGNLGGKGYIQKIADMRKQYMNIVEALSALTDTLYDETNAPHWAALSRQEDPEDRKEVRELIEDAEQIRDNPQTWAEEEMAEEFDQDDAEEPSQSAPSMKTPPPDRAKPMGQGKTASEIRMDLLAQKVAYDWMAKYEDELPGGLADKGPPKNVDPKQVEKGVKVEMEHTDDPDVAREIAYDHLTEDPRYYDKLETIEGEH